MEDDWASPWADADDRSPTEAIRNLDVEDTKDAGGAGIDVPRSRTPSSSVAVHTNHPWSSGEHGFGDASAWASSSPAVGSGEIPGVVGGSGLLGWAEPVPAEAPSFAVKRVTEGKKLPSTIEGTSQQPEPKEQWFRATDEADAWAAGSDWGDVKTVETDELNLGTKVSSEVTPEIRSLPGDNALVEGVDKKKSPYPEGHKGGQSIGTETSDNKSIEGGAETKKGGIIPPEIVPTKGALSIPKTASVGHPETEHESKFHETEAIETEVGDREDEGDGDDDDDFGDFADEENFEDAEGSLSKDTTAFAEQLPPLPQTPSLKVDIPFDIDTSLLNKLYPILTSYPKPPPLKEIIHTTDSRKAWYRLSQSGTIRKDKSGDDNYVRVTWGGSKVQEDVNKIVSRWMAEDRSSGGGVALGGSRRLGAMFGWGEGVESVQKKAPPVQLNLVKGNHSHKNGLGFTAAAQQPGVTKSPFGVSTAAAHSVENEPASSPHTMSFGWSSFDSSQSTIESHPSSSSNSIRGDEKLPSTPYRASFQGTSSRMSSQPVTPSRSVVSHSPIASSHSSKLSDSLATTRPSSPSPQSTQRTAEVTATTPIIPTSMDSFPSSTIPVASMSMDRTESAVVSVPSSNFDEWGAFENITATVKPPSTTEANCNPDEWGAFESLKEAGGPKPTGSALGQGRISTLLQPSKTPEARKKATGSNEDEWGAFAEPSTIPGTAISDGLSEKSSTHATTNLEKQPGSEGREIDDLGSLTTFVGQLMSKPPVPEQPLTQPPIHIPIKPEFKTPGGFGLNAQKTDGWGSFDALESSLAPNPHPIPSPVSEEPSHMSIGISDPKAHSADNWGSFEAFESALTPKPKVSNQILRNTQASTTQESARPAEKAQNIGSWGSFDAFEAQKPKKTNIPQRPPPVTSNIASTKSTTTPIPQVLSTPTTNDDDDWGEMVQSPEIPRGDSPFSAILQPTSLQPTLSHNSTPRAMSPAPFQSTQPQTQALTPNILSTTSMFDFGSFEKLSAPQKADNTTSHNSSGVNDTWDLSFFEVPVSSTSTPVNVSASASSNQASSDLWDAPPPKVTGRRENTKEMEESKLVNQLVEGLPDLSYMLQ